MSKGMLGMLPLSAVRGPVDALYDNLAGEDGPRVLEELKKFNRRDTCWKPVPVVEPELPPLLVFDAQHFATVDLSVPHDPASFWHDTQETPARYVWPGFTSNVVAKAKPRGPSGIVKVPYAPVSRTTTVRDILRTPGVGNFEPDLLSQLIAAMISRQPKGEPLEDGLDPDGNLFSCGSVLVHVRWLDDCRPWHVSYWDPGSEVLAGRRVFSGNMRLL